MTTVSIECADPSERGEGARAVAPAIATNPELDLRIRTVIDEARPRIVRDGGDIEFVSFEAGIVRVRLTGACTHCQLAAQTLGELRRRLVAATGEFLRVLPAFD